MWHKALSWLACGAMLAALPALGADAAQNMIGRQTQNEGVSAVPAKGQVAIDGKLGEWDLSGQIWSFLDIGIRDQFSVKSAAMWDADNLYLSFVWRDPTPLNSTVNPDFDASRGWVADALQLRVQAAKQSSWLTAWCYNGDRPTVHLAYWEKENDPGKMEERLYTGKPGETKFADGIESAYVKAADGKGWVHELKLPWKVLFREDVKMAAGQKIRMGMEFLWGDVKGNGWPMHRYADNMQPGVTSREFFWTAHNAWGDLTLADKPVAAPRKYIMGDSRPAGTIPVRAVVPADAATFTLVIEDQAGKRVRNLAGEFGVEEFAVKSEGGQATVEVMWDGTDDHGALVAAGSYKVRGLTQKGVGATYDMCFYNPGTPPWQNLKGTGGWGADHNPPSLVARAGERMVVCCHFAEGGSGTFALGPDGKKIWSEIRGTNVVAANDKFAFIVPNDWGVDGGQLLRLNVETGKFTPFVRDGKEMTTPTPFADVFKFSGKAPKALALAAKGDALALVTADGRLRLLDANTAEVRQELPFVLDGARWRGETPKEDGKEKTEGNWHDWPMNGRTDVASPFAFDGQHAYCFRKGALTKVNLADGAATAIALEGVELPSALALDDAGNLLVADQGRDMQVKKFSPDGKLLQRYGRQGGRAADGPYDPHGMRYMSAIAVADDGKLWVVELSKSPRRLSVWNPDGSFAKEYVGNTGYAASGTLMHDSRPEVAFAEGNLMTLDRQARAWKMAEVMWVPDPAKGEAVTPGSSAGGHGQLFSSKASGEEHEYYVAFGDFSNVAFSVYMKRGERWFPVSAITRIATVQGLMGGLYNAQIIGPTRGQFANDNAADVIVWNDQNGDGYIQRAECEIIPADEKAVPPDAQGQNGKNGDVGAPLEGIGWGQRVNPADFSWYAGKQRKGAGLYKIAPAGFAKDGAPLYSSKAWKKIATPGFGLGEAVPVPGAGKPVIAFLYQPKRVDLAALDPENGNVLWTYPNPYHQVHASHNATMPRPGLLIGSLKIVGVVPGCGEGGDVFMVRGNLGQDYYLTSDGLFVASMFKDCRLPSVAMPATEEELRGMPLGMFSGGGEHFCGWIGRQSDGVVRMTCGLAREAGMVTVVEGLESIKRFAAPDVAVSAEQLAKAAAANEARAAAAQKGKEPYRVAKAVKTAAGAVDFAKAAVMKIEREGQPVKAELRLAYDADNLYGRFTVKGDPSPWKNTGKDFAKLFKTGDCVDLQLSPRGNQGEGGGEGDLRLLVSQFDGKTVAVFSRPVAPGAPADHKYVYSSPIATVAFDEVRLAPEVKTAFSAANGAYEVTFTAPWKLLGVTPASGLNLRADAGFILSDDDGKINTARVYWNNQATNLVNDLPHEAMLKPGAYGSFVLE